MGLGLRTQSFEAGTVGANVGAANPPSANGDTAFTGNSVSTNTTITIDNTVSAHGSQSMKCSQTTATPSNGYAYYGGYATTVSTVRGYFRASAIPLSGNQVILRSNCNSSGTTDATRWLSLTINSAGILVLSLTSTDNVVWTSPSALVNNQWYRFSVRAAALGTTSGNIALDYYLMDSNTPVSTGYSSTTANTGSGNTAINSWRFGRISTTTMSDFWWDDIAVDDTNSVEIGPVTNAPTANAGTDQVNLEPFDTVILNGSGSSAISPATIQGYSWIQTAGPTVTLSGATTVSPTYMAPATVAGCTITVSLTVTDSNSLSSLADTVSVSVLPHTLWRLEAGSPTPMQIIKL